MEKVTAEVLEQSFSDVYHVLKCFEQMGASSEELEQEFQRLVEDADYCKSWCKATGF